MDAFRLALPGGERNVKMLLACSGGLASSVLVEIVYTASQRTRGKYQLPIVVHVDETTYQASEAEKANERLAFLKVACPEMTFIERTLDEINHYAGPVKQNLIKDERPTAEAVDRLAACLDTLPSMTSQQDMLSLYRERLLLETAKEQGCSAIIYGNSGTSLAAKTLSLTTKGRGYALPWETADHSLSHSGIWSVRPMKGLLNTEIQVYAKLINMPAPQFQSPQAGKANSIDELTRGYFETLEEQFPSLVATVVRTTNKLVEPLPRDQALGDCKVCGMSYRQGARKWLRDITVNTAAPPTDTIETTTTEQHPNGGDVQEDLCYGCVVATRGAKQNLRWPTFPIDQSRQNDTNVILKEYELKDH